jgi:hypothetical protein
VTQDDWTWAIGLVLVGLGLGALFVVAALSMGLLGRQKGDDE